MNECRIKMSHYGRCSRGTRGCVESHNADAVNPSHYDGDACMCAIEDMGFGVGMCIGTAVKYLWRQGRKHPRVREDIAKAQWYLDRARGYQLAGATEAVINRLDVLAQSVLLALEQDTDIPDLRADLSDLFLD